VILRDMKTKNTLNKKGCCYPKDKSSGVKVNSQQY